MSGRVIIYGTEWCGSTHRVRRHLEEAGVSYHFIDIEQDDDAAREVEGWESGKRRVPQVLIESGGERKRLSVPSQPDLDAELDNAGLLQRGQA